MRTNRSLAQRSYSGRNMPKKKFYIFFRLNTKYALKYAVIEETNIHNATNAAMVKYGGVWIVANVHPAEFGASKAKALNYTKLEE